MSSLTSTGTAGTTATLPAQYTLTFPNAAGLDPTKGACFLIGPATSFTTTGVVATEKNGPTMTAGTHFLTSTSGTVWSTPNNTQDMYIEVYYKYRYLE